MTPDKGNPARDEIVRLQERLRELEQRVAMSRDLQQELRREREFIESALDASSDTFFVFDVSNGRPVRWNQVFRDVSGYSDDEIARMTAPDDFYAEDDLEAAAEALRQLTDTGHARVELPLLTRDGVKVPYEYLVTMIGSDEAHPLACSIGRDMTERRRIEDAVRRSEERHRGFLDSLSAGVVAHGPDAGVLYWNRMALELLGMSADELTGAAVESPEFNFLREDGAVMSVDEYPVVRTLSTNRDLVGLVVGVTHPRTGTVIWVVCNSHRMLDDAGELEYVLISFVDITDLRKAEEERRRFDAQLLHTQKLESLGILAGGIAHDFNNLLMAVLGNADLALHDLPADSPLRTNLMEIGRAARRASGLAQQMLAYSGRSQFVVAPVDINGVVTEMRNLLRSSIPKKTEMETRLNPEVPAVKADADQLRQVVMNLITNASEAIGEQESGRIELTTCVRDCDEDDLQGSRLAGDHAPGRYVCLEVRDSGCGMDEETLAKIFDPFFTTKFTGRGLGLAGVLGIVRGHGGLIMVESQPAAGATFQVLLPALPPSVEAEDQPAADLSLVAGWRGAGTILVVDDEPTVLGVAVRMAAQLGFEVLSASDGLEAVQVYSRHADTIVCTLLDMTMPGMDGSEAFREIKRLDPEARILMSSGFEEADMGGRFPADAPDGFIKKPYTREDLAGHLRRILAAD